MLRLDFPLGLGCAGATGHLCLLLLPCSFFQNTVGEEMQMYFWKLHSDQDIWDIFHPASTAAGGFSHFRLISAPATPSSHAECSEIEPIIPIMVLLQPPKEPGRLWSQWLLPGQSSSATPEGMCPCTAAGTINRGLRLWIWGTHIHIWPISKLLSVGSIFSSKQGGKVVTFFFFYYFIVKILCSEVLLGQP